LLTKVNVWAEIRKLRAEQSERTGITADMVLKELAKLGFSNMSDYATWGKDGVTRTNSEILTEEQTACILEVSETKIKDSGTVKFK